MLETHQKGFAMQRSDITSDVNDLTDTSSTGSSDEHSDTENQQMMDEFNAVKRSFTLETYREILNIANNNTNLNDEIHEIKKDNVSDLIKHLQYNKEISAKENLKYCLAHQNRCRQSNKYKNIECKMADKKSREELSPEDIIYFALVTDDIKKINIDLLGSIIKWSEFCYPAVTYQIKVIHAALSNGQSQFDDIKNVDPDNNNNKQEDNIDNNVIPNENSALNEMLAVRKSKEKPLIFLNLAGAQLSNINLAADLDFSNLGKANFENSNLTNAYFYGSNLTEAILRNAKTDSTGSMTMMFCIAIKADLRNFQSSNCDLSYSNFTEAKFQNAKIDDTCLRNTKFNQANLRDAKILLRDTGKDGDKKIGFKNACLINFSNNISLSHCDLENAQFLDLKEIKDKGSLEAELNRVEMQIQAIQKKQDVKKSHDEIREAIVYAVAKDISKFIADKKITADKNVILNAAIENDFFQPKSDVKQLFNLTAKTISSFTSSFFNSSIPPRTSL